MFNRNCLQFTWSVAMVLALGTLLGCQPAGSNKAGKAPAETAAKQPPSQAKSDSGTSEKLADKGMETNPKGKSASTKRLALFQYADSPLHDFGVRGIVAGLATKGFVADENLELSLHNALRNDETAEEIAQEIADGKFDVVVTTGTPALQAVAKANQNGPAVQVFGMVANPFRAGVGLNADDPQDHPANLVGVGSFPPVEPVFELARELYPDLKVVGVVWNPAETNSVESTERARAICEQLEIELLEAKAGNGDEVTTGAKTLVEQGAQMLWIGADNTAHHAADQIIAAARAGGIPVISSLPGDAERGALVDLSHDWNEVGKAIGSMAGDVLAGTDPRTIEIQIHADRLKLILNETALDGLKDPWKFPATVVERADQVVKKNTD